MILERVLMPVPYFTLRQFSQKWNPLSREDKCENKQRLAASFKIKTMLIFALVLSTFVAPASVQAQVGSREQSLSITVMPMMLEVKAPKVSENITVRNNSRQPMKMQFRVYRWQKKNGQDFFAPTSDVVVTPPFVTIRPGADGVARVVRVSKKPLTAEESYRVFVDQVPPSRVRVDVTGVSSGVAMTLGQAIPAFFYPASAGATGQAGQNVGQPIFSAQSDGKNFQLIVTNPAQKRLRLSDVELLAGGVSVARKKGLLGYALPGEQTRFKISGRGGGLPDRIRYTSDSGRVEVPLQ